MNIKIFYLLLLIIIQNNQIFRLVTYTNFYFSILVAKNIFNGIQKVNNEICVICLSKIKNPVRPDGCYHIFCQECFQIYSQSFTQCPTCKKNFFKIITLYSLEFNTKKIKNLFFNDLSGDRLYRLSLKKLPDDICIICKKDKDKEFLIRCDKCGVNFVHYYCDLSPQIGIGYYICPICRVRCYKKLKK